MCDNCSTSGPIQAYCDNCNEFVARTIGAGSYALCEQCNHRITSHEAPWTPDDTFATAQAPALDPSRALEAEHDDTRNASQ